MTVSAEYATEHFAELLSAADRGEAVIITREDHLTLRLSREASAPITIRPRSELFGSLAGQIWFADNWDSPEQNKEIADEFLNGEEDDLFRNESQTR